MYYIILILIEFYAILLKEYFSPTMAASIMGKQNWTQGDHNDLKVAAEFAITRSMSLI